MVGANIWADSCSSCHGDFDGGVSIGGSLAVDASAVVNKYDVQQQGFSSLMDKIAQTMPTGRAATCVGRCASDLAAYIASEVEEVVSFSCDASDPISYGQRKLILLTSDQYQNSLEDLLQVTADYGAGISNNDGSLGGFTDMGDSAVLDSVASAYIDNAELIADWAISNNKPFSCTSASACATEFVQGFANRVFRRPLTEQEQQDYANLFSGYGAEEGLRLALTAALSSPQFLYRSEVGVEIAEAIEAGYYANAGGSGADSSFTGVTATGAAETVRAVDFDTKGNNGSTVDGVVKITHKTYYALQHHFEREFTGPTLIQVKAHATSGGLEWPQMRLAVSERHGVNPVDIGTVSVNSQTPNTYSFTAEGFTGRRTIHLFFDNLVGDGSDDNNLFIDTVSLADIGATAEVIEVPEHGAYVNPLTLADADAYVLTPFEYATSLSYALTGSTPDVTLLAAAGRDQLTTPAQIQAHVDRLIVSDRGRQHFGNFVGQWFKTDQVTAATRALFPELTPAVKAAMAQEVKEQFKHVFYNDEVPFSEFYSADYTFLNDTLAQYYQVPGSFDANFVKAQVPGRGGPIASGAWMTVFAHAERTSPIRRAVHARTDALCHNVEPPNSSLADPDIDAQRAAAQAKVEQRAADLEAAGQVMSSKEFYYTYTDNINACASCHERTINPMFGLEDFDNVGRLRPSAGSGAVYESLAAKEVSVSLSGTLFGVEAVDGAQQIDYQGAKDFSNKIANTQAVQACLVRKGFRYATGYAASVRDIDGAETLSDEQKEDFGCAESQMKNALISNGQSPKAMFSKLGTLNLMRFRK